MRAGVLGLTLALVAGALAVAGPAHADVDIGNISVMEADATILQPGEPFDLDGRTLTWLPRSGGGYTGSWGTPAPG